MTRILYSIIVLLVVGCRDNGPKPNPDPPAQSTAVSGAASSPNSELAKQELQEKELQRAWQAFKALENESIDKQIAGYRAVLEAKKVVTSPKSVDWLPDLKAVEILPVVARLEALDRELAEAPALPEVPAKPENNPPKYLGAFPLSGRVRKCYKDGVLLESNGKFYFVRDAVCPDVNLLTGHVEDTGSTVEVDIGRNGREAMVVTIADKESAREDRVAHQKALVEYQQQYTKDLAEYQKAVAERAAAERALGPTQKAKGEERDNVRKTLKNAFVALIKWEPGSPVPSISSAKPTSSAVSAPASTEDRKKRRDQCVKSCLSRCQGDSSCERACVTTKC